MKRAGVEQFLALTLMNLFSILLKDVVKRFILLVVLMANTNVSQRSHDNSVSVYWHAKRGTLHLTQRPSDV